MRVVDVLPAPTQLEPQCGIVIWGAKGAGPQGQVSGSVHSIVHLNDGGPELGPGSALTHEALAHWVQRLAGQENTGRALNPEYLLYSGGDRALWWRPARRRPIFFHTGRAAFDKQLRNKHVIYPNLLFLASPGNLFVWALADSRRPVESTPLFRAPFLNLYLSGHMCNGTSKLPLEVRDVKPFERAFFETTFTHSNLQGSSLTAHPEGHDGLWKALVQEQPGRGRVRKDWYEEAVTFPAEWLAPLGKEAPRTVGEALNLRINR